MVNIKDCLLSVISVSYVENVGKYLDNLFVFCHLSLWWEKKEVRVETKIVLEIS